MFTLIKKITGGELDKLYTGLFCVILDGAAVAAMSVCFCLFFYMIAGGGEPASLWFWASSVALCFVLRIIFSIMGYQKTVTTAYTVTAGIRLRLGAHFKSLPMGFFARKDLGSLSNAVLQDTGLIDFLFSHILIVLVYSISVPLFLACILAFLHLDLLALALVPIFLAVPVLIKAKKTIKHMGNERLNVIDKTDTAVLEHLQGIKVMKSYGILGSQNTKLIDLITTLSRKSIQIEATVLGYGLFFAAIVDLGLPLVLFGAAMLCSSSSLAGETAVLFLIIAHRFYAPFMDLMQYSILGQYMLNAGKRIEGILDTPPLKSPGSPQLPEHYDILFSDVSFSYNTHDVLKHINFQAKEKSMTALVGPSGSGKTTAALLMARFWDTYRGKISIGGVDIRHIDPEQLLSLFSFVFQDVYLFEDTVLNNIWVGKTTATHEAVLDAARKAHCHEFISRLPKGYDTPVGEGGSTLSGGEKQRISIARAILKDAPIVILDEATTALDPINEKLIQAAIDTLVQSKTLVVIAHRLHTIARADTIVVLERGEVHACGTHTALIEQAGRYFTMWQTLFRQTGSVLNHR